MLEILALGNLTIRHNGENLENLGSRAKIILAYLAMESGQHNRNILAATFWPESSEAKSQNSLRVALSALRTTLGSYVDISHECVSIKSGAQVYLDVFDFEEKITSGHVKAALILYKGDLLEGIYIPDSIEFENWRRWEQERLKMNLINAMQSSLIDEIKLGHYVSGQELARALLKFDPLNEVAYQQYMIALALDGKRTTALEYYQKFCALIADELNLEPTQDMEDLKNLIHEGNMSSFSQKVLPEHNLPTPQTSFIGRERELGEVIELIKNPSCRLLTLYGPGGVGKTRLALQAVRELLLAFPDGVFYIPLETVSSPDLIVAAIAAELHFKFDTHSSDLDAQNQLLDYLKNRSILLILDGFEHLTSGVNLLSIMGQRVAKLMLVVTSQQVLNIQGEWVYQVKGLPVPEDLQDIQTEMVGSLDLFKERVNQANPGYTLTDPEREQVVRICHLVEGLPLGIELAAAWASVLSISEIAVEIERNFEFLALPMHDHPDRHRSLRATFNHSWKMLDGAQQEILARLSVFRGGFSRNAAQQVANTSISQLSALLHKSMLTRDDAGRLNMHSMVRQFTKEKLLENPVMWQEIQGKHSQYFADVLRTRMHDTSGSRMVGKREEVRQEIENVRAAVHWLVLNGDETRAMLSLSDYFFFYVIQGWHEGVIAFEKLAQSIEVTQDTNLFAENTVYLNIRVQQAFFYSNLGLTQESERLSRECLQPLREKKLNRELAICLHNLGVNAIFRGDYETARPLLEEAICVGQDLSFPSFPSFYLWLGYVYFLLGKYEQGMMSFQTSHRLFSDQGHLWGIAFALSKMGLAADGIGQYATAMEYHQKALDIAMETGDLAGQGYALSRMSVGAYFLEDYQAGIKYGQDAYQHFTEIGHRWGICASLSRIGFALLGTGNISEAEQNFYNALEQAKEYQLSPLCLYALAGLSCAMLMEGNQDRALELYHYVQQHPTTPALYADIAKHWFQKYSVQHINKKKKQDALVSLDHVIQEVLHHRSDIISISNL